MTSDDRPGAGRGTPYDSETAAANYLGGGLRPRAARTFEHHLLGCESCWQEVDAGRAGRRLAESARQVAPPELREQLRAVIASEVSATASAAALPSRLAATGPGRPRRGSWVTLRTPRRPWRPAVGGLALAAAALGVLVSAGVVHPGAGRNGGAPRQPTAVRAAVADFRALRLPGTQVPRTAAPDLSQVQLHPMGAAAGVVGGRTVTAYSYRDPAGRDLVVYLSREPFPTAVGAQRLTGPDGPWIATTEGVTVLCARSPHALLVLGLDRQLVLAVAGALDVT